MQALTSGGQVTDQHYEGSNAEGSLANSEGGDVGKVCILSIDGGGMRGIIPGRVLAYLEAALKEKSGNQNARIADYFDVAAGTSVGGILATMLFTSDKDGVPLFTGEETWSLIAEKGGQIFKIPTRQRAWSKLRGIMTPRYSTKYLEGILKQYLVRDGRALTLRDTVKPVLIPCYDLQSANPFLFSRADALDAEAWDFTLWEICRATSAVPGFFKPTYMKSMDGSTTCTAIDGGVVMNNPTAAAITHVLHNKSEFPHVRGVHDLLVLSLGCGQFDQTYGYKKVRHWGAFQWAKPIVKIIMDGISDMVDHTISMSFGELFRKFYVRVQCMPVQELRILDTPDIQRAFLTLVHVVANAGSICSFEGPLMMSAKLRECACSGIGKGGVGWTVAYIGGAFMGHLYLSMLSKIRGLYTVTNHGEAHRRWKSELVVLFNQVNLTELHIQQVSGLPDRALTEMDDGSSGNVKRLMKLADELLKAKSMEHLPFGGRRPLHMTNMQRLDWFAEQLVQEQKARALRKEPTVILKPATTNRLEPMTVPNGMEKSSNSSHWNETSASLSEMYISSSDGSDK